MLSWPLWSPLGLHVGFHRPSEMLAYGLRTGCGRRQLIETNECLKNRRLVDVRGVMVLGVAGITEPVEITLGELDLSTIVRAARDSKAEKIRDVSQLTTGLSACEVRAVRRINPDCWYEVESLSSDERTDNEAMRDQYDRAEYDVSFWG